MMSIGPSYYDGKYTRWIEGGQVIPRGEVTDEIFDKMLHGVYDVNEARDVTENDVKVAADVANSAIRTMINSI